MSRRSIKADKEEGALLHREVSPTAASAGDPKFGPSGVQTYRVSLATPFGLAMQDVDAATGDEAAEKALAKHPGAKVAAVKPASDPA